MLGILVEGPTHPYHLHLQLKKRTMSFPHPVSRATLYNLIRFLKENDWVAAATPTRSGNRPEKTVYSLTAAGFKELVRRLYQEITTPGAGDARFIEAVSHVGALGPRRAASALKRRVLRLAVQIEEGEAMLASAHRAGTPRLFVIEAEYVLQMKRSERDWVRSIILQIESGALPWPRLKHKVTHKKAKKK